MNELARVGLELRVCCLKYALFAYKLVVVVVSEVVVVV